MVKRTIKNVERGMIGTDGGGESALMWAPSSRAAPCTLTRWWGKGSFTFRVSTVSSTRPKKKTSM